MFGTGVWNNVGFIVAPNVWNGIESLGLELIVPFEFQICKLGMDLWDDLVVNSA